VEWAVDVPQISIQRDAMKKFGANPIKLGSISTDCSLKPGYMKKELLVIVNQDRYGENKIRGVLTTRQVERDIIAGRVLFYILCCLLLIKFFI